MSPFQRMGGYKRVRTPRHSEAATALGDREETALGDNWRLREFSCALPVRPLIVFHSMSANNEFAIYVRGLRKSYDGFEAVKGIDFEVRPGEVFGLLGPNGAGKTSTVEILEGLRPRTAGDVKVLEFDPDRQKQRLKDRIGVCLQATNLPDKITVREALNLFGSFYTRTVDGEALLKRLQLWEKKD